MDLISVIIPTYNRYDYLLNAINSVKKQTYTNIEIIVINDCSTQKEYYQNKLDDCIVINLDKNSKQRFGHASPGGFQRSIGMKIASGKYIAFLDDDDIWMPTKLEKQIEAMKKTSCLISATDGYFGLGVYNPDKKYQIYNKEKYQNTIKGIYSRKNKGYLMEEGFPLIWNEEFLNVHNCCIASSIMIDRSIIDKVGYFSNQLWAPDYEYWLRIIKYSNLIYLDEPLLYWDSGHGDGQKY